MALLGLDFIPNNYFNRQGSLKERPLLIPTRRLCGLGASSPYIQRMPRKPIELPPKVAKAFVAHLRESDTQ